MLQLQAAWSTTAFECLVCFLFAASCVNSTWEAEPLSRDTYSAFYSSACPAPAYPCCAGGRWEQGDFHEWSAITYPDELHDYVTTEFQKIKQRQADLLGIKNGIRSKL